MKSILIITAFFFTIQASASQLQNIKTLTDSVLQNSAQVIKSSEAVTHWAYKKVLVLKASGTTAQQQRQNTMAQAAHTLCPYFDEGVGLTLFGHTSKDSAAAVNNFTDESSFGGEESADLIFNAISQVNQSANMEIYSGEASGNNTMGTVIGIYDLQNNEIAVFANTNCGSDD